MLYIDIIGGTVGVKEKPIVGVLKRKSGEQIIEISLF
jgi:hypothetical protein